MIFLVAFSFWGKALDFFEYLHKNKKNLKLKKLFQNFEYRKK
jgi:hypothetical protein